MNEFIDASKIVEQLNKDLRETTLIDPEVTIVNGEYVLSAKTVLFASSNLEAVDSYIQRVKLYDRFRK